MKLFIEGIGLLAPGLSGWPASQDVLAGIIPYQGTLTPLPMATLLPSNERRRAPEIVRVALAVGLEALTSSQRNPAQLPAVFASSGGEGNTIHEIMCTLADAEPALSPTHFHNSVHNVCAGYWSIATGSHQATTSVCAYDGSFAAGLLEAGAQAQISGAALLIAYDMPYPAPLGDIRSIGAPFFGIAFVLASAPSPMSVACLSMATGTETEPTLVPNPSLEVLRRHTPAARCLPLLCALAEKQPQVVVLDYLPGYSLPLEISFINSLGEK
ncbi:beta-ketoacyl synthase chain length factor [Acidithiobacillus sp. AMEEHan]|uniref:beta-ketoacyl synthase chain length factor n=1 Tax=Acidithiobacillus sp. AMEEHan TaxID=2994951 RepID=UPI0027E585D6|nr:beta-ketoacyl synthase chain length factor [Acidithiobacillus sp. AMEEHan]